MTFLVLGLLAGVITLISTGRWVTSLINFLMVLLLSWGALPVLNYGFFGLPALLLFMGVIVLVVEFVIDDQNSNDSKKMAVASGAFMTSIGIIFVIVIPLFTTWGFFHANEYRGLIGEVENGIYSTDTTPVDITQVRRVDQSLAARLADKRLGEDMALGSQVDVGTMRIQKVRGQLYWVGPLDHSGFWKWFFRDEGTPGYVMVSATNERDVRLVQDINGEKIYLKYNGGCYFGDYLPRYLYNHGYMTKGLSDYTFEVNDEGEPCWVVTKYEKKVGFAGSDAVGVVVVDAQTGDIKEYSVDEAPVWIDRIQPDDFVTT